METKLIVGLIIGIIILLLLGVFTGLAAKPNKNKNNSKNSCSNKCGGGKGQVVLFYTTWCRYCKDLKPIWTKLQKEFGSDRVIGVDADKSTFYKKAYNVNGYPSIYWCPKGLKHSSMVAEAYNNERSEEALREFITEKLYTS